MSIPVPEPHVAVALASVAIHAREMMGPHGHDFDRVSLEGALASPGVSEYLAALDELAMLPVQRGAQ